MGQDKSYHPTRDHPLSGKWKRGTLHRDGGHDRIGDELPVQERGPEAVLGVGEGPELGVAREDEDEGRDPQDEGDEERRDEVDLQDRKVAHCTGRASENERDRVSTSKRARERARARLSV
eukprot:2343615-Rhodomonas_salina.2